MVGRLQRLDSERLPTHRRADPFVFVCSLSDDVGQGIERVAELEGDGEQAALGVGVERELVEAAYRVLPARENR
jgi:hypothetical protein